MQNFIFEDDKMKEECGVFGIYSSETDNLGVITYYGLYSLQHRGQESCGIASWDGDNFNVSKGMGLVSDVFNEETLANLKGKISVGHVRYSTTGASHINNAQPMIGKYKLGSIAIAHNGNLTNADIIRDLLEDAGGIFQTSSDSEVILSLIARGAKRGMERAITEAIQAIKGSYAIVILTEGKLIGVRDPNGIRPLCMGEKNGQYVLCSESCALDTVGATYVRDIEPGEIVIIDENGVKSIKFAEKTDCATCSFEYIYFARPDSIIDGIEVYKSRVRAGEILFEESPVEADVVTGVPDSGIPAAVGFSNASGIPYGITFIKNRYVGRTFISPTQELRDKSVHVKLNALKSNVEGKRVVIIDDSIVRGTTSKHLVQILRNAGAKEVHMRISSPPVKYPCYFGIDISTRQELIGAKYDCEEICQLIGADSLAYLSIEGLLKSLENKREFCLGCFKGTYPISAPIGKENE